MYTRPAWFACLALAVMLTLAQASPLRKAEEELDARLVKMIRSVISNRAEPTAPQAADAAEAPADSADQAAYKPMIREAKKGNRMLELLEAILSDRALPPDFCRAPIPGCP